MIAKGVVVQAKSDDVVGSGSTDKMASSRQPREELTHIDAIAHFPSPNYPF